MCDWFADFLFNILIRESVVTLGIILHYLIQGFY